MEQEFGKWLLDISKYLVTAMLLATAFGDMSNPIVVVGVIISASITLSLGLFLIWKSDKIKKGAKINFTRKRKYNK